MQLVNRCALYLLLDNTESNTDSNCCKITRKVEEISWGQSTRLPTAVHDLLKISNLPLPYLTVLNCYHDNKLYM